MKQVDLSKATQIDSASMSINSQGQAIICIEMRCKKEGGSEWSESMHKSAKEIHDSPSKALKRLVEICEMETYNHSYETIYAK